MMRSSDKERNFIRDKILWLKRDMGITDLPKVYFVSNLLSKERLLGLHLYGDCLVSLHKGEGWGLCPFEGGLAGNPVIATGWGGNTDFMSEDDSFLVKYMETFVGGMSTFNPWYLGTQKWAEPDLVHASELMRYVFENKEEAAARGKKISDKIKNEFSWEKIADIIIKRLGEI